MNPFRLRTPHFLAALMVAILAVLAACGGGVDSGGTGAYASGPITGYGSIVVGGVHYDERLADIRDEDGTARAPADLQLGMMTEIQATAPAGSASMPEATAMSIRYRSELLGPVTSVDAPTNVLKVMGLTVTVESTTVFDPRLAGGVAALKVGDIIEVYGQLDAQAGRYVATRIDARGTDVPAFKLRGLVTARSTVTKTLVIGGQTIDYSQVAVMPRMVTNSSLLRVLLKPDALARPWVATRIDAGARTVPDRDIVEVEGRVTAYGSIAAFEVDGVAIRTDAATLIADGAGSIALGVRVEVDGSARDNVVTARRVEVKTRAAEPFEFSGTVSLFDAGLQTFVMRGFTIHYSASTRFDSSSPADLRDGRRAAVKGSLSADGTRLEASTIHVESAR